MSASGELTPDQVAELHAALLKTLADAERDLAASSGDAKPVDLGLSIGRLSRMDAMQQQQMALARRGRVQLQLQQVRAALLRLEAGSYGVCVGCGEPIGHARLRVRPETTLCRECQSGSHGS